MDNRKRGFGVSPDNKSFIKKRKKGRNSSIETDIDNDVIHYFLKTGERSRKHFNDNTEKQSLIDNALSMTVGHEVEYANHRTLSFITEKFLLECSDSILLRYIEAFSNDLRAICCNPCASNVLESILKASSDRVFNLKSDHESNENSDDKNLFFDFVLKVSQFLLNNLDEFLTHSCANRVTRTAMLSLSGYSSYNLKNSEQTKRSVDKMNAMFEFCLNGKIDKNLCPKLFKSILKQFTDYVLNSWTISEYKTNPLVSGLLQSLLVSLHTAKLKKSLKLIIEHLTNIYSLDEQKCDFTELLTQEVATLLSAMIVTSSSETFEEIYKKCFSYKIKDFAVNKATHYCVLSLIDRCADVAMFEQVYNELCESFDQILPSGYSSIFVSLSKACNRLHCREKRFIKDMTQLLGCKSDSKNCFFYCLLTLRKHDQENSDDQKCIESVENVSYHGSVLVQECLKSSKPEKIMNSLLATDNTVLVKLLCNKFGSRIADVMFGNEIKNKTYQMQFIKKLKGSFAVLATDVYGSFTVTSLWKTASFEQKLIIVDELVAKESLMANKYGSITSKIVDLHKYRHQPDIWKRHQKILSKANDFESFIK